MLLITGTQAPVDGVHVWQTPLQGPEQHTPSSQDPDVHSPPTEQVVPAAATTNISAVENGASLRSCPPATSTLPEVSSVAVWP
jgi:hypothetical protein